MEFRGDDRAQSIQIGAILLFGILIITLATFQATVVPDQNAGVEFDHSQTVQSDMQDLRNGILQAAEGDTAPTRVTLGTTYPSRFVFINPPPPTGRLRTVGADDPSVNVTIGNASGTVVVDSQYENAREYWETAPDAGVYNTSDVIYSPDYAEYDGAPTTVYGNSVLFNRFDNGANRTLTGQRLIQGNTVNLVALRGDLSETGVGSETVDVTPVSERARTVTVESTADDPLYINVSSRLSASVWNQSLLGANAEASGDGTVTADGITYNRISIELAPGTYRLRGGAVGVGALSDTERDRVTKPAYLVVTDGYEPVGNQSNGEITVEVRDRFNNPVTGAEVNVSVDGTHLKAFDETDALVNDTTLATDADGKATARYRAVNTTDDDESASLNVSIGGEEYEKWNASEIVIPKYAFGSDNQDDDDGEINPGSSGDLIQTDATIDATNDEATVTFNYTGGLQANITAIRMNFYLSNPPGNSDPTPPDSVDVTEDDGSSEATDIQIPGSYVDFSNTVVATDQTTLTFAFNGGDVRNGDFFVMTLVYEIDGELERTTYFVSAR